MWRIAVCYLARDPEKKGLLTSFLKSYRKNRAGIPHELIILVKGASLSELIGKNQKLLSQIEYRVIEVPDSGFDIGSYFYVLNNLDHDCFCFLNSYSEILVKDWLKFLMQPLLSGKAGLTGSTGSWGSAYTNSYMFWPINNPRALINKIKLAFAYPSFPNPHIRSNAFAIPAELGRKLKIPDIVEKTGAYLAESGRKSITRQIHKMGYETLIVNRDGESYHPKDWDISGTFWSGEQAKLLVADNQTRNYQNGKIVERSFLKDFAWTPPSLVSRYYRSRNRAQILQLFMRRSFAKPILQKKEISVIKSSLNQSSEFRVKNVNSDIYKSNSKHGYFDLGISDNMSMWMKISFTLVSTGGKKLRPQLSTGANAVFLARPIGSTFNYVSFVRVDSPGEIVKLFPHTRQASFQISNIKCRDISFWEIVLCTFFRRPRRFAWYLRQILLSVWRGSKRPGAIWNIVFSNLYPAVVPYMNSDKDDD